MCPKTKYEEIDEASPRDPRSEHAEEVVAGKRPVKRSGSFRKPTQPPPSRPVEPPSRSAREEKDLIGVETTKASRYVFVSPRHGKKKPNPSGSV